MGQSEVIRVGIAGVRDYKGLETARLIARHPGFRVVTVSSDALAGNHLRQLDPDLGEDGEAVVVGHNDAVSAAQSRQVALMFSALPPVRSSKLTTQCLDAGIRVVDLSGAHRLRDPVAHLMT